MPSVLIVDDEPDIRALIREYAQAAGYVVFEAENGLHGCQMCIEKTFDIIIADVMMPKLNGISMCKNIKKVCNTPILMLSARGEEYDKLFGFDAGVDDYVVKPFSPRELIARMNAIIARSEAALSTSVKDNIKVGDIEIDLAGRTVSAKDLRLEITGKEFDLLAYLARNKNIVCSRDSILDNVWGQDFFGDDRLVDAQVKLLRKGLGKYRDYIKTIRGVGYKLEVD